MSLMAAPLVFGGDMTKMDPFTLSLLTNAEVIAVDQDALGKQAVPVFQGGGDLGLGQGDGRWLDRNRPLQSLG